MKDRLFAVFAVIMLGMMIFSVLMFSVGFIISGKIIGVVFGVCLVVFSLLGIWALYKEVNFGILVQRVESSILNGGVCPNTVVDADIEEHCQQWEQRLLADDAGKYDNWYYLAVSYKDAGNRKKARAAMGEAIQRYRRAPDKNNPQESLQGVR